MTTQFTHPENQKTDIGHFMIAAGAIIQHPTENKILLLERADSHHQGDWEIVYGRISQHEEITDGLHREVKEETGLIDLTVERALRFWHIYRGEKHAETEVFGMTFVCKAKSDVIKLDPGEHSGYQWLTPERALSLIKVPGIKKDIELFMEEPTTLTLYSLKDQVLL